MSEATVKSGGMTRREFLYYIWGASMALFTAEFGGLIIWFAIPRFREGQFGGTFRVPVEELPDLNERPRDYPDGRFWLVNLDTRAPNARMYKAEDESEDIVGIAAIYKVCTHLGCIYAWNAANERFECPCHGSKYRLDGRRVESPAPRTLDRFEIIFVDADGQELGRSELDTDGAFATTLLPAGTAEMLINTGSKKQGASKETLCTFTNNCP